MRLSPYPTASNQPQHQPGFEHPQRHRALLMLHFQSSFLAFHFLRSWRSLREACWCLSPNGYSAAEAGGCRSYCQQMHLAPMHLKWPGLRIDRGCFDPFTRRVGNKSPAAFKYQSKELVAPQHPPEATRWQNHPRDPKRHPCCRPSRTSPGSRAPKQTHRGLVGSTAEPGAHPRAAHGAHSLHCHRCHWQEETTVLQLRRWGGCGLRCNRSPCARYLLPPAVPRFPLLPAMHWGSCLQAGDGMGRLLVPGDGGGGSRGAEQALLSVVVHMFAVWPLLRCSTLVQPKGNP